MSEKTEEYYPEFYDFPPFYTLQPVIETRKQQLKLWHDFIISWHKRTNVQQLNLNEWPLFSNAKIERALDMNFRKLIVEEMIATGHAEWRDETKTSCLVLWRSISELSSLIYDHVEKNGMIGSVHTMYELYTQDEDTEIDNSVFQGIEPELIRKAIEFLEKQEKAVIFHGNSSEEDGVKFLER